MINLIDIEQQIATFLKKSIQRFKNENITPNSMGIYCCPWAGWVSLNYNLEKTIEDAEYNCPDFEFVEYDILNLPVLSDEYENEDPVFTKWGNQIKLSMNSGDERLNEIIFNILKPIGKSIKQENNFGVLIQMLDSKYFEKL